MLKQIRTMIEGEFECELEQVDTLLVTPWKRHPKGRNNTKGIASLVYLGGSPLVRINKKYIDELRKVIVEGEDIAEKIINHLSLDVTVNHTIHYELSKVMTANVLKPKGFQFVDESEDEEVAFRCYDNGQLIAWSNVQLYAQGIMSIKVFVEPAYRKLGIGTYLASQATKRLLVLGITPMIQIKPTNIHGMRMVNNLNYSPSFSEIIINA